MEKKDYCQVAETDCKNPPAYGVGGSAWENPTPKMTSWTCSVCGQVACKNCRLDTVCLSCYDEYEGG